MPSLRFSSQKDRMAHPQAQFIPHPLWTDNSFFRGQLDTRLLSFMQCRDEELIGTLNNLAAFQTIRGRQNAWLALILSHPGLNHHNLHQIAVHLNFEKEIELKLTCVLGKEDFFLYLIAQCKKEEINSFLPMHRVDFFQTAAGNGSLEILYYLAEQAPDKLQTMIKAGNYFAFRVAAEKGHIVVLRYLAEQAPDELQIMIQADNYSPFYMAATNGHIEVLRYLAEQAPAELSAMIKASNYFAFRWAAANGHIKVLRYLAEQAPDELQAMIKEGDYSAFRWAASHGHIKVVHYLAEQAPDEFQAMIKASDYYTFRMAALNRRTEIVRYLLNFNSVLGYAEEHDEYTEIVSPHINQLIVSLHQQKAEYEGANPNGVFNVSREEAQRYFYCLRYLIRCGTPEAQSEIVLLLSIPAVKAIVHTAVTPGRPNELLRLALIENNSEAAAVLMAIPEVRALAAENNYYRDELSDGLDAQALAQDHESSMRALTPGERRRLEKLRQHYQVILNSKTTSAVMDELRTSLETRYAAHPACIQLEGRVLALPLTWDAFQQTELSPEERALALKAYYQNKDHSVLRYLSKPNPWMHAEAGYVNFTQEKPQEKWSTFEEYQTLIALLFIAAKDEEIPAIGGFTIASRLSHFIDELALIGRAHNWDKSRSKKTIRGEALEEYDDLEGDRPSCYSGVNRRLFQSVMGHPLISALTAQVIKEELRDFVRAHFKQQITPENKAILRKAWTNTINADTLTAAQQAALKALDVSMEEQNQLFTRLSDKYMEAFTGDIQLTGLVQQAFALKNTQECHALSSTFAQTNWHQFLEESALEKAHNQFLALLRALKQEGKGHLSAYPEASLQAKALLRELKIKAKDFYQKPGDLLKFKESCLETIKNNSSELVKHQSFLDALFVVLEQFFIVLKALFSGSPRFFDSRSRSKVVLDDLEANIIALPGMP